MYGKYNMETYITICKIDSQWKLAVWLRKLKQGLCINLEQWDGEGDGREVQKGGDICIPIHYMYTSKLKWIGMGEFNSDDHYTYYCGQESPRRNGVDLTSMQSTS